jgi:hypothetical protein
MISSLSYTLCSPSFRPPLPQIASQRTLCRPKNGERAPALREARRARRPRPIPNIFSPPPRTAHSRIWGRDSLARSELRRRSVAVENAGHFD